MQTVIGQNWILEGDWLVKVQNHTDSKSCKAYISWPLMTRGAPGPAFSSDHKMAPPIVQEGHTYL